MTVRLRKFIGTVTFALGSTAYFWIAMSIAWVRLPGTPMSTQLLFYLVTTLIWLFWAGLLIRWMEKPS